MKRREKRRCRKGRKKEDIRGEKQIKEDEHKRHEKRQEEINRQEEREV